jgi:hypothetical protein
MLKIAILEIPQLLSPLSRFLLGSRNTFGRRTYNARSETVADKPSYRHAWKHRQFGVAIMQGFYEPNYATGKAVRWRVSRADAQTLLFSCRQSCRTQQFQHFAALSLIGLCIGVEYEPVCQQHRHEWARGL